MKMISPTLHGWIDYGVVLLLVLSPMLFGLPPISSMIAYALAGVHLVLTITTIYPSGFFQIVPFPLHGWVELVVSIFLLGLAFVLGATEGMLARTFYLGIGTAVFIVWALTNYEDLPKTTK